MLELMLFKSQRKPLHNLYIRTLIATLARREEVLNLTKEDIKKVKDETNEYFVVAFRPEISKGGKGREIVIDAVTWRRLNDIEGNEEGILFPFTLRNANYIINRYRFAESGANHAIRHGIARFIYSRLKNPILEDQILKYYMGHSLTKQEHDKYTLQFFNYDGSINFKLLAEWYRNYHPIMLYGW